MTTPDARLKEEKALVGSTAGGAAAEVEVAGGVVVAAREAKALLCASRALQVAALLRLVQALSTQGPGRRRGDAIAAGAEAWGLRKYSADAVAAAAAAAANSHSDISSSSPVVSSCAAPGSPTELCMPWASLLALLGSLQAEEASSSVEEEKGTRTTDNIADNSASSTSVALKTSVAAEAGKWYSLAAEAAAEAGEYAAADKYTQLAEDFGGGDGD
mmetsp:Transcript_27983/g.47339  ORF Transcript_27983/g.47339 Transcript_27983/m.47339 type:complete len:216 (+) Transcript_27983:1-648(+)